MKNRTYLFFFVLVLIIFCFSAEIFAAGMTAEELKEYSFMKNHGMTKEEYYKQQALRSYQSNPERYVETNLTYYGLSDFYEGMDVYIPFVNTNIVYSANTDAYDTDLSYINFTKEDLLTYLEGKGAVYCQWNRESAYQIYVKVNNVSEDFKKWEHDDIYSFLAKIIAEFAAENIEIIEAKKYQNEKESFSKIYYRIPLSSTACTYVMSYSTVYQGKIIEITMESYNSSKIEGFRAVFLQAMIDNLYYGTTPPEILMPEIETVQTNLEIKEPFNLNVVLCLSVFGGLVVVVIVLCILLLKEKEKNKKVSWATYCHKCGHNEMFSDRCHSCKTKIKNKLNPLRLKKACSCCGEKIHRTDYYCRYCGKRNYDNSDLIFILILSLSVLLCIAICYWFWFIVFPYEGKSMFWKVFWYIIDGFSSLAFIRTAVFTWAMPIAFVVTDDVRSRLLPWILGLANILAILGNIWLIFFR